MAKTKDIVTVESQLSNLDEVSMNTLFNSNSSGLDGVEDSRTLPFPLQLGIVQKLTGDNLFKNPDDNDRKALGKIFIRPRKVKNAKGMYEYENKLTKDDLHDELKLTLLKVEFGVEIWRKENKDGLDFPITVTYARSKNMIRANERDAWIERYNPDNDEMGYRYTNQVRLILTPYAPEEVIEMAERGDNPFVTISLAGTDGWNTWGVINEGMTLTKKQFGVKGELKKVLSSMFKITLSTVPTTSGSNEYYIFNASVSANDAPTALKFADLVNSLDTEFTFFFNTQDQDPSLRDIAEEEVLGDPFADMETEDAELEEEEDEAVLDAEATEVDDDLDGLPF